MRKTIAHFFLLMALGLMLDLHVYAKQKISFKELNKEYTQVGIEVYNLGEKSEEAMFKEYKADDFVATKVYKSAIIILELAVKQNPENIIAHYYLGKSYHKVSFITLGEYDKEYLKKAKKEYLFVIQAGKKSKEYKEIVIDSKEGLENVDGWLKD